MSASVKDLAEVAKRLRNAAPLEFREFAAEFGRYTEMSISTLVHATGENVLREQGHSQVCMKLLRVLDEVQNV
jgi:hypothetical protein